MYKHRKMNLFKKKYKSPALLYMWYMFQIYIYTYIKIG